MTARNFASAVGIILKDILGPKCGKSLQAPNNSISSKNRVEWRSIKSCFQTKEDLVLCLRLENHRPIRWILGKRWWQTEKIAPNSIENESHVDSFSSTFLSTNPFIWPSRQQTLLFERYLSFVWRCSQEKVWILCRQFWVFASPPSHTALILHDFLAKNSMYIVSQPPYSPDLAPYGFWLFLKLKKPLQGNCFKTIEEVQREVPGVLKAIPEGASCSKHWKLRWCKCVMSKGDYFGLISIVCLHIKISRKYFTLIS